MRPRLKIDLGAIAANYRLLHEQARPAKVAVILKANAYGIDAAKIAPLFFREGCRSFFVHDLGEAKEIESILPLADIDIFVLSGLAGHPPAEFGRAIPILNNEADVHAWREFCQRQGQRPAALHVDTGLSRLGMPSEEWERLKARPDVLKTIDWRLFMSHLACSDDVGHPMNAHQLSRFRQDLNWWRKNISPNIPASLSASGGIFLGPEYHFELVRPGAALYGLKPNPRVGILRPALRLEAPILQVRPIDAGNTVGYGATHSFTKLGRIATLGIGYADGIKRSLGNQGWVLVQGKKAPIIGRVSMDLMTIDISHLEENLCREGDFVTLIDDQQSLDDLGMQAGTIGYEIMTGLGHRLERLYIGDGSN